MKSLKYPVVFIVGTFFLGYDMFIVKLSLIDKVMLAALYALFWVKSVTSVELHAGKKSFRLVRFEF